MILSSAQYTTVRDLQRNYKKLSAAVNKTNNPFVVLSNNKPHFVLISMEVFNQIQNNINNNGAKNLLDLTYWAEEKKVKGPKDLSENLDTSVWGEK